MFKSQLAIFAIATVLTSLTAFAHENHTRFKSEASVQTLGSFVKQTTQNGAQQDATSSAGVLATKLGPRSFTGLKPTSTSPATYSFAANTAGSFTTRQHSIWPG